MKVQLVKRYPYIPPTIEFDNIKGLDRKDQKTLLAQIQKNCRSLAESGLVMVCELVQLVEDFLLTHNKDPTNTNSAWDQMNAREEEKKKVDQEKELSLDMLCEDYDDSQHNNNNIDKEEEERIQKECARQMEALRVAEDRRRRQNSGEYHTDESDEESFPFDEDDDLEYEESYSDNELPSSSRYRGDFYELKTLGRGGGGMVVQARNKLDRRTYAVKKIELQPEHGKFEKMGKLENAKLKREVTTISRMTHKNIVRYYQAWVEGGDKPKEATNDGENQEVKDKSSCSKESSESSKDSKSSRSKVGFWTSSFHDAESISLSTSWSDNDEEQTTATPQNHDDIEFGIPLSPLLVGFGLNGKADSDLMKHYQKSSSDGPSEEVEDSDSELDTFQMNKKYDGSQRVLYIQMEYCSSTLRHLIDDSSLQNMEKDEIWKLVRQILEALDYIHKVRRTDFCWCLVFFFRLFLNISVSIIFSLNCYYHYREKLFIAI